MKSNSQRRWGIRAGLVALVTSLNVAGMGADYPNDQPVPGLETWPVGLSRMINATNRVHGFFINAEDTFFFSGTATNFTSFLQDYAKLPGVAVGEDFSSLRLEVHCVPGDLGPTQKRRGARGGVPAGGEFPGLLRRSPPLERRPH